MYNKPINTENITPEFLFSNMAIKNIDFALISLYYILDDNTFNANVYGDEHTFFFFHINNVLNSCRSIYNIFFSVPFRTRNMPMNNGPRETYDRGKRLRAAFDIHKAAFPLVFQVEARNTFVHFDERYDAYDYRIGDFNLLDMDTPDETKAYIMSHPHLRTYNKTDRVYYTYDRNRQLVQINMERLRTELQELRLHIINHPNFKEI